MERKKKKNFPMEKPTNTTSAKLSKSTSRVINHDSSKYP